MPKRFSIFSYFQEDFCVNGMSGNILTCRKIRGMAGRMWVHGILP